MGCLLFALMSSVPASAEAEAQSWRVFDQAGSPLAGAVLTLSDGTSVATNPNRQYQVAQEKQQFSPRVLIVPAGSTVSFPNKDTTFHHVYSFSPAKTFELKLYKGDEHAPLLFAEPGLVELGCNIHDRMRGYVYVTGDPVFGISDAQGGVLLPQLPPGFNLQNALVTVWHDRQLQAVEPFKIPANHRIVIPVRDPPTPVKRGLKSWKSRQ